MNTQPQQWTALSRRSPEIKEKVEEVFSRFGDKQLSPTVDDLYEDSEWGSLAQSDLYRGLIESCRLKRCLSAQDMLDLVPKTRLYEANEVEPEVDDTHYAELIEDDAIGKPLEWFVANPPNQEVCIKASDILDIRILDLYVTHVNETGETYFPQLESQLRAYYEMIALQ